MHGNGGRKRFDSPVPMTHIPIGMSITNSHPENPSIDDQIRLYARIGFDTVFLATGVTEEYHKIPHWSETAQTHGIRLEGVHGPTGGANELWEGRCDGYYRQICRIIDHCRDGMVDKLVLHGAHGTPPPVTETGLFAIARLEEYAQRAGVRICWENSTISHHFQALATRAHMGRFHGVCLDAGHHQCYTPELPWQDFLGGRILYTHLHDNRGIHGGDLHLLPYDGVRDWDKLALDLVEAGYAGTWNLELSCNGDVTYREMGYEQFVKMAYERVRRLVSLKNL